MRRILWDTQDARDGLRAAAKTGNLPKLAGKDH